MKAEAELIKLTQMYLKAFVSRACWEIKLKTNTKSKPEGIKISRPVGLSVHGTVSSSQFQDYIWN